jgi:hypothetical protein
MESSPKSEAWLEAMPANVSNLKKQKSASARWQRAHLVLVERQNKKRKKLKPVARLQLQVTA